MIRIAPVRPEELASVRHLTFQAAYELIRERFAAELIAFAGYSGGEPVGLAIGVCGPHRQFEILSVYVADLCRRQGIGTLLLSRLEEQFATQGYRLGVHFLTVDPADQGAVRFLMKQGWTKPVIVKLICRSTLARAFETPWLVRARLPDHHRVIPWRSLTVMQQNAISAGVGEWIPEELDPFEFEAGYDESTSIALVDGEGDDASVAGWVLTHRLDASTLRWTCSFVNPAIQGSARILPLWREVALRQRAPAGPDTFVFTVPLTQSRMVRFAMRYMRPWLTSLTYSCMTTKAFSRPRSQSCA